MGLGANLGDRRATLEAALAALARLPGTEVVAVSDLRETAPWGFEAQPPFLNAVAELRTGLAPPDLLAALREIERGLGRTPTFQWGPREIDLDLLLYGSRRLETPTLTLPHPRLLERPFVCEPLAEIAPEVLEELRSAALSL